MYTVFYLIFIVNGYFHLWLFQALAQVKGEIQKLKESIHRLEEIDESREELRNFEMELQWAMVSSSWKKIKIAKVIFKIIVLSFRRLRRKINFIIYRRP